MPAEWDRHAATWLSWPHDRSTWPGRFESIPPLWAELTKALATGEEVHILAGGPARESARSLVGDVPNVVLHDVLTNDVWARDHGPTFLVGPADAPPALIHWNYNAWGGKFRADLDSQVPQAVAAFRGAARFTPGIVLEGGSIEVDGCGNVLVTEQCLLNPNRNPQRTRADLEQILRDNLGVQQVLWLGQGLDGDDTDGHIDDLTRFVAPGVIVTMREPDPADVNHAPLEDNFQRLQRMRDGHGRPFEIVSLTMPRPRDDGQGRRLPGSYANFYIANAVVLVPLFADPADQAALDTLQKLFPTRRIVGLDARELIWEGGTFHCLTQQEPARPLD